MDDNKIVITDNNGEENVFEILFTYEDEENGNKYVMYYSEGDDEQIFVDLQNVPLEVGTIVFAVNIYDAFKRNQHFGMIRNAFIRVVDYEHNVELCRFELSENYYNMTALVAGALMRTDNGWEFITDGNAARVESLVNVVAAFAD